MAVTASTKAEYDEADLDIFEWSLSAAEMARLLEVSGPAAACTCSLSACAYSKFAHYCVLA